MPSWQRAARDQEAAQSAAMLASTAAAPPVRVAGFESYQVA
jgi:hypothetical protein